MFIKLYQKQEADLQRNMNIKKHENKVCHKAPSFTNFYYSWKE